MLGRWCGLQPATLRGREGLGMADISMENHDQCQERKENVFHEVRYCDPNLEKTSNMQKGNASFQELFRKRDVQDAWAERETQKCARQTAAILQPQNILRR